VSALWAITCSQYRALLQYRAAAFAGLITQLFFGLVLIAVMRTFYLSARGALPLNLGQVISYLWLGQAFFSLMPWRADPEVKAMISSGGIAYELLRPIDLYAGWFARALALKTAPVLLRAIPLFVLAMTFFGLKPPASIDAGLLWLLAVAGAVALSSACTVLINLSLLWTLSADGVQFLMPMVVILLSGQLIPLPLFPGWSQPVLTLLPFRGMLDTPDRIWLGSLSGPAAWQALAHQWIWVGLLVAAGRQLLKVGLRRVVIQGG